MLFLEYYEDTIVIQTFILAHAVFKLNIIVTLIRTDPCTITKATLYCCIVN